MNASDPSAPRISLEFFPPTTDQGEQNLLRAINRLAVLTPEHCSVTYGAGGGTRDRTMRTVELFVSQGLSVVPHLSFGQDNEQTLSSLLDKYLSLGIRRLLIIGGDTPKDCGDGKPGVRPYAIDLVRFIRRKYNDAFNLSVAAYPEVHHKAVSAAEDLHWLKEKVSAGADRAVTQYFYNADAYEDFLDRIHKANINAPIYPGIMPIYNYSGAVQFAKTCGAEIPRWMLMRMREYQDDPNSLRAFGVDVVTALCEKLIGLSAPGLHFYALNQSKAILAICERLGLCTT